MINIILKEDIEIYLNNKKCDFTQKKLRALLAFLIVEGKTKRQRIADIFFDSRVHNVRNSMYLINKQLGTDLVITIDRNSIGINPRLDIEVDKSKITLTSINLNSALFLEWRNSIDCTKSYYIHQELVANIVHAIYNNHNCIISGASGSGKTELALMIYNEINFSKKLIFECNRFESNFSLNLFFTVVKGLQPYVKNLDLLKMFSDFTYNNHEAFEDDNNLLNLHYIPIEKLIIESIENEITHNFTIIIEDIEYIDRASLNIITKLIKNNRSKLNFVFTTTIDNIKLPNTKNFKINPWDKQQLKQYLKESYPKLVSKCNEIYEDTKGNPYKVNEYINGSKLKGNHDFDYLDAQDKTIMQFCSCFNQPIPVDYINKVLLVENHNLSHLIDRHLIIIRPIGEQDYIFFYHRIIKDTIYNQIDDGNRIQFHSIIARYFESIRTKGNIKEVNDIYYHYSKTHNITKQVEYRIKYLSIASSYAYSVFPLTNRFDYITDNTVSRLNIEKEIVNIETLINNNLVLKTNLNVLLDFYTLKNRYDVIKGTTTNVKENIDTLIDCSKKLGDNDELLKSYYIMMYYGLNFGNTELIDEHLKKIDEISPIDSNPIAKRIEGYNLALQNNYNSAIFVINEAIELSTNLPKEIAEANLVACYAYLGESYIISNNYKRALRDLERGKKIVDHSINFISGSIIIDLFLAITHYHLKNQTQAKQLIEKVVKEYDNNQLCWKRSLCYLYAKLILKMPEEEFEKRIDTCTVKYHNYYEKALYNKLVNKK